LTNALAFRPDDAEAQVRVAALWQHLYRVRSAVQLRSELGSQLSSRDLWNATSLYRLHTVAVELERADEADELQALRKEPAIQSCLEPAWGHLVDARAACPLLPEVHLQLACLEFLHDRPSADLADVQRAYLLAPTNANFLIELGIFDVESGRLEAGYEKLRKAWTIDPRHAERIWELLAVRLDLNEFLDKVVPGTATALVELGKQHYHDANEKWQRREIARRARELLAAEHPEQADRYYLLAGLDELDENLHGAIDNLQHAVRLRPNELSWRYELAVLLKEDGRTQEARDELKWCVWSRPNDKKYHALMEELTRARVLGQ
jgi:tetratricopeptide (TPR) repeat protein